MKMLQGVLKSQYHAALAMLRQAIDKCPADSDDAVWFVGHQQSGHPIAFWHIAYHVLYYTHLYLMPREDDFQPWAKARDEEQTEQPFSKAEIIEYWQLVDDMVDDAVDALDLDAAEDCGFWWYNPMSKLEHQLVSIRHVQHHAAQLADRLRAAIDDGVDWAARGKARE